MMGWVMRNWRESLRPTPMIRQSDAVDAMVLVGVGLVLVVGLGVTALALLRAIALAFESASGLFWVLFAVEAGVSRILGGVFALPIPMLLVLVAFLGVLLVQTLYRIRRIFRPGARPIRE